MSWLGLDIGSSYIKGAVLDCERRTLRHITRVAFPERIPGMPSGRFEVEPSAVVAAVRAVLEGLLAATADAEGVLVCGQMGGVILVDSEMRPLTHYLSWRDERAAQRSHHAKQSLVTTIRSRLTPEEFREIGNELQAGSALSLLAWIAAEGQLPRLATPLSIGDFVIAQLTSSAPRVHGTQALGTLNLETRDWHHLVFERLGLAPLVWPPLQEFADAVGYFEWGGQRLPVYPVLGDHQCALVGTGLVEGELSINISTGSQVSILTPSLELGSYQTRPYVDLQFLNTITHLPAGRSLEVLVNLLGTGSGQERPVDEVWSYLLSAAESSADADLTVRLTFFAGPLGTRGSIENISVDNLKPGSLFRAALRSMAENYEQCAERLAPGHEWTRIVFSGGLAQKLALLRTMVSTKLPGPVRLSAESEDTLRGLLALALVLDGTAADVAAASKLFQAPT